ncbi:MAG TPA: YHS domain-containing protein [Bryobacteraceae bacterium]|nr:YHS domain-containing protein [Bryobacteraceae bacterium]
MTIDHVCDMEVDEGTAAGQSEYAGDRYYFCSLECKKKFDADPAKYVSRTEAGQS